MTALDPRSYRHESVGRTGPPSVRVGLYYAGAATAAAVLAFAAPWPLVRVILVWPVFACVVVAVGYFGLGPTIYGKRGGRIPPLTAVLLAPPLLGQYLSLVYYRRQSDAWNVVTPRIVIGGRLREHEAAELMQGGVTAVLDLTAEFSEARPLLGLVYRNIPILDLTAPTPEQLRDAMDFVGQEAAKGKVYVHCKIGYSRTATVVGAALIEDGVAASADEAVGILRRARPPIVVRPEALRILQSMRTKEPPASAESQPTGR